MKFIDMISANNRDGKNSCQRTTQIFTGRLTVEKRSLDLQKFWPPKPKKHYLSITYNAINVALVIIFNKTQFVTVQPTLIG